MIMNGKETKIRKKTIVVYFEIISMCFFNKRIKGEMEVARRRGRRRKKLLDDLKDRRGYSHLKEEALDRTT